MQIGKVESKLKALGRGDAGDRGHRPRERPALLQVPADPLRLAANPQMSTHRAYGLPKPGANIECGTEGLAGAGKSPSDEEILTAARALHRVSA